MKPRPVVAVRDGAPMNVVAGSQSRSATTPLARSVTTWLKFRAAALNRTANSVSDIRCCAHPGSSPSICSMTLRVAAEKATVVGRGA